jgi:site-specific recombinase XerD
LGDVIDEYLKSLKPVTRSYRDGARYGKAWKARFGGRALEEITAGDLEKIRTERLATRTPATVNRELAFLKRVYSTAIRDEKTDRTPFARLKLLREPSGRVRYLSDEQEARLMEKLSSDADRDRVRVLLTIPRSKNGETRHVPMTSTVRAILARLPRALTSNADVPEQRQPGAGLEPATC